MVSGRCFEYEIASQTSMMSQAAVTVLEERFKPGEGRGWNCKCILGARTGTRCYCISVGNWRHLSYETLLRTIQSQCRVRVSPSMRLWNGCYSLTILMPWSTGRPTNWQDWRCRHFYIVQFFGNFELSFLFWTQPVYVSAQYRTLSTISFFYRITCNCNVVKTRKRRNPQI